MDQDKSRGGRRHERNRYRRRGAPQGRSALHHRQRPLHRRHQPARPGLRLFPSLAARPCHDQIDRRQGGGRHARRAGGAHRRGACRRQDRQSDLRLDDPFQGRLADEDGGASGARQRQGLSCRRSGRGRDRRDAGAGARRRRKGQGRLRGAAGGRRSGAGAEAGRAANPRRRAQQHHLSVASRRPRRRPRPRSNRPSTSPSSTSSTTGWCRTRSSRARRSANTIPARGSLHAVEHHAEPARRAARHRGLRRHGAGAQAARDRARCRRRLRLEDFHLSRGSRGAVGVANASAGR